MFFCTLSLVNKLIKQTKHAMCVYQEFKTGISCFISQPVCSSRLCSQSANRHVACSLSIVILRVTDVICATESVFRELNLQVLQASSTAVCSNRC